MNLPERSQLVIIVSASALLLVPCIWLPQIESLDLCSHIYNAWLARLITEQHMPGLWIARQSTNILFDNLLTLLMTAFGPVWAQLILVSMSALLFFWSAFVLVAALSDRRPWFLRPAWQCCPTAEFSITDSSIFTSRWPSDFSPCHYFGLNPGGGKLYSCC